MTGLMLFIFTSFEAVIGHGIAIASFAATVSIISFRPSDNSAKPRVVAIGYLSAAVVGFLISFMPLDLIIFKSVLGVGILVAFLIATENMHPPAVAYLFGFILGGYGLNELLLTIPALAGFFVSLAVVAFVIEQVSFSFGLIKKEKEKKSFSLYERLEKATDMIVPYALVVLFISLTAEIIYPENLAPYALQLAILDWSIIFIFLVDLTFKFRKIGNFSRFIKKYWLDVIATIPFFVVFRFFQGMALAFEFIARGAVEIPAHTTAFLRFLRPLARFPRFARMLEHIENISSKSEKA